MSKGIGETKHAYRAYTGTVILLTLFAVAFGIIEASAAHYLRLHFYPGGFTGTIQSIDPGTMTIEMIREFATMVVLACVAWLSVKAALLRLVNFIYVFAAWDLVYYLGLYCMEGWPRSLFDQDLLFLIPVPWFAPVLAPAAISCLGLAGAVLINLLHAKAGKIKIHITSALLIPAAWILWLISFLAHFPQDRFPLKYDWYLLILGIVLTLAGFAAIIFTNRSPGKRGR